MTLAAPRAAHNRQAPRFAGRYDKSAPRLRDMLEAIEYIERYAIQGREAFERDELIQNWMVRHLQIIGEAARSASRYAEQVSDVP